MIAIASYRGPDNVGEYHDPEAQVSLSARRLSILDLGGGAQPMTNEDGTLWVVFNGEIYNAPELRASMVGTAHRWASDHSDTELLLHLYEDMQEGMVERLNGMFSFVIYDQRRQRLFGARDRLGIKPFYYALQPNLFVFASELKSLLAVPRISRELNHASVFHYMSLRYLPDEHSIFQGVRRLRPGHWFTYNLRAKQLVVREYWRPRFEVEAGGSEVQWCERVRGQLRQAVKRWTLSDVPIGCSLSGGIDSSALVGLLAEVGHTPIRTYSLGFASAEERAFNELPLAREVARRWGTEHHEVVLSPEELLDDLVTMVWHLDEPYGGGLPSWYIYKFMHRDVKVALTGTGGDELFGNYGKFHLLEASPAYRTIYALKELVRAGGVSRSAQRAAHRLQALLAPRHGAFQALFFNEMYYLADDVKRRAVFGPWADVVPDSSALLEAIYAHARASTVRDRLAYLDVTTQLAEEFLLVTDRFSMAHAVEARVPFLDHELVELLFRIPAKIRTRPRDPKYLLKRCVSDVLPPSLLNAPKRGFVIPTGQWLRTTLRPLVTALLHPQRLQRQGIFQPAFFSQFVQPHLEGRVDYADQVWTALMFQLWHAVFIEAQATDAPTFSWRDLCAPASSGSMVAVSSEVG